jgi:demethylmenaquinone methyltransferase/2-methoxy-6-polyprenyl-1,4-benzoquinol methylase
MSATDGSRAMAAYYERRAPEYDDWYLGRGLFEERERPGWHEELAAIVRLVGSLGAARTLDVACGTGFITRHLRGDVVGLDGSQSMLEVAGPRVNGARVRADGLTLPFRDDSFDRLFTGHFYGHLDVGERDRFLAETRRVASELVVLDAALRDDVAPEELQTRVLSDGSTHQVYKRYFTTRALIDELGSGESLHEGRWFVVVSSRR